MSTQENLDDMLSRACDCHAKTCLDPFNATCVRNWRTLWRSLPASSRREALLDHARQSRQEHMDTDGMCTWKISYQFNGLHVCKAAFQHLTGIGSSSLQEARSHAEKGSKSRLSRSELGNVHLIANTSNPKLYLDARTWLVQYADTHADQSPISLEYLLPSGRKFFYHAQYEHERITQKHQCASLKVFLKAWRIECPWLVVVKSISKFVKCGLCEYLKMLIDKVDRKDTSTLGMLRANTCKPMTSWEL